MTNHQHGGDNSTNTQQNINEMSGGTAIQNQYNYYAPPTAPPDYKPGGLSAVPVSDPDDVPRQPRHFVGRADLRTRTLEMLNAGKNALLCGFGGMGKTALAAVITADWIRANKGAALWLQAGSETSDALFEALGRPFGREREITSVTGVGRATMIQRILRDSGTKLLALDDAWNGEALKALENSLPRDLRLLVTSRFKWPLDAEFVDVGQLPPDEALQLLTTHARREVAGAELCQRLGYHAFALEIAGKTIHADGIDPAELLKRMGDRPHALAAPDGFAEAGRASVTDLIDASLNALDEETKRVFLAFGVFFTPTATAELLQIFLDTSSNDDDSVRAHGVTEGNPFGSAPLRDASDNNINTALSTLTRRGLADKIPAADDSIPYYRVHDLAYSYTRDFNDDSARDRAANACLTYTERYNTPKLDNFRALRPELDNLIGAAKWAMARELYDVVERFAWNLYTESQVLSYRGFYTQAVELLTLATNAAERQGNHRNQCIHLGNLGTTYRNLGQFKPAIECNQQALTISRKIVDRPRESLILSSLGSIYSKQGDYKQAVASYQQALTINREIGNQPEEGKTLGDLGNVYYLRGQSEWIFRQVESSISESSNQTDGKSYLYAEQKDFEQAIEYLEEAIAITRKIGDRHNEANWLNNLGLCHADLGEYDKAIETFRRAVAIAYEIGDKRKAANWLNNLGLCHADSRQHDKAIEIFEQAAMISREIDDKQSEANYLSNIGKIHGVLENYGIALDFFLQARAIYKILDLPFKIVTVERDIADARAKLSGS